MKERTMISTIMTSNVITLNIQDSLSHAEELFNNNSIRHIPVVSGTRIIGILSYSDMLRIGIPELIDNEASVISTIYDMYTLEQVMTKNVKTLSQDEYIKTAVQIFSESEYRALPIVDAEDNLVGILSTTDIMKYLLSQFNI